MGKKVIKKETMKPIQELISFLKIINGMEQEFEEGTI